MSDKVKRTVTDAPNGPVKAKSAAGGNAKSFSTELRRIADDFGNLLRNSQALGDCDNLLQSHAKLQQEAEEMKEELENARKERDEKITFSQSLVQQFGAEFAAWAEEKSRLEADSKENSELKRELEVALRKAREAGEENSRLRGDLDDSRKQLKGCKASGATLENKFQRMELKLKETMTKLSTCRETLETVNDNLGIRPLGGEKIKM